VDTLDKELPSREDMRLIRCWVVEMCKLFRQGGHLQAIEVELDHFDCARPHDVLLNLEKFQTLLKPLESLNGLKSVVVKSKVTETYGANEENNGE
jgi:hypothetical protein